MERTLLGSIGGGGERVSSGGSATGPMPKEDNMVMSSDVSFTYPNESEPGLDLGLWLSLGGGCGGGGGANTKSKPPSPWATQYAGARIFTAQDFPSGVSNPLPPSSSSSSSVTKINGSSAGTKRTADSVSPTRNGSSQVVGWPPIRAYRMNSLVNQAKSPTTKEFNTPVEKSSSTNGVVDKTNNGGNKNNSDAKEKGFLKTSLFVKVNRDGIPIGRKVDLNAHSCYETLAQTLHDMFCRLATTVSTRRSNVEEHDVMTDATGPSKLLDGSSDFVLTYEDKEGDWMLVGDVPWGMFLCSVKRFRIMRTSEANGLAPKFQERNGRQRTKPI